YSSVSKDLSPGDENSNNNKTVYTKLRIAKKDFPDASGNPATSTWQNSHYACLNMYSENGETGWRLPTQREMQAIWIFQEELKTKCSSFTYLGEDYYWAETESAATPLNAWMVYGEKNVIGGGGTSNRQKLDEIRARCVKEL
ncbi:MAG: DUF1566 domain-containing protein, partial [Tannerella sp.]|nr:DUF1566 domain-containing protein [Tannerella sp.]